MQYQDGHISTCFNKKILVIYILYRCLCQLSVIRDLFSCAFLFVINRSFILFIVRLFILFHSHRFFVYLLFKREKSNSDPEPCSGISILLTEEVPVVPATCHQHTPSSLRVNKHHTADSTDFVLV
jgi:hypothetical protein